MNQENQVIAKLDQIQKTVDIHSTTLASLETKFGSLETKFGSLETKVGSLETTVNLCVTKLINLEDREDRYALNDRVDALEERMMNSFDQQMVILQRLDQERLFSFERVRQIEDDVSRVKKVLNMS